MGSGNSKVRPTSYESKSAKEMMNTWVETVESVYKFGTLEDIQLAYENINVYKGAYTFTFDPDIPKYNFDYVHEVLENKNFTLDVVCEWFKKNKVQMTPRTMLSAVESGNIEYVKHFCKDGVLDPTSNNFYPVFHYDGYSRIMNTGLVTGKDEDDEPSKHECFEYASIHWKKLMGPYLVNGAIKHGHLDILKWLFSQGISTTESMAFPSVHKDIEIFNYLVEKGYTIDTAVLNSAIECKDPEYLDWLVLQGDFPIDTSLTTVPGEYNSYNFFGGVSHDLFTDILAVNPHKGVLEWMISHGFKLPTKINVGKFISCNREDLIEYMFEHDVEIILGSSRDVIVSHPELLKKVLYSIDRCSNDFRKCAFSFGDESLMEIMKDRNFLVDTDEKGDSFSNGSCILVDSLERGNISVAAWAKKNGYGPSCVSDMALLDSVKGSLWALDNGYTFFGVDKRTNDYTITRIMESWELYQAFKKIIDFKDYEGVFKYKLSLLSVMDGRVAQDLERDGVNISLPYKGIPPCRTDWEFVKYWKKCKAWDEEKFMTHIMKYRIGKEIPWALKEALEC